MNYMNNKFEVEIKRPKAVFNGESKVVMKRNNMLQVAIGPVIVFVQFFGILPIAGAMTSDARKVRFKWISIQVVASILLIGMGAAEIMFTFNRVWKRGLKLYSVGPVTFFIMCEIGMILFFNLARHWPEIIRIWQRTEEIFHQMPYRMTLKTSLKTKVRFVAFTLLLFAFTEHLFYLVAAFHNSQEQIEKCNFTYGLVENVFRRERPHIFDIVYFKAWMVPILEWINVSMTTCWSFIDIFLTIISISIAERFKLITERLKVVQSKVMPESFWIEIRYHYIALSDVLFYFDDQLSSLILLSCTNNLYVICVQLFNASFEIRNLINKIYFWYSILFVIARTLCILFAASSIHDASRQPLPILRNISSMCWSLEVQRLTNQVSHEVIAFSGKRFFFLTRKLIFAMAGTVVTYELVLLDQVKEVTDITNFCQIFGKE